jgi:hypothetical protein
VPTTGWVGSAAKLLMANPAASNAIGDVMFFMARFCASLRESTLSEDEIVEAGIVKRMGLKSGCFVFE